MPYDERRKFDHLRAWLEVDKEEKPKAADEKNEGTKKEPPPLREVRHYSERRVSERLRNVSIKGWFRKSEINTTGEKPRERVMLVPTYIVDISNTGASIRTQQACHPGHNVYLSLKLKPVGETDERLIKITCEVIRSQDAIEDVDRELPWKNLFTIGVKFVEIDPADKEILEQFLKSTKEN